MTQKKSVTKKMTVQILGVRNGKGVFTVAVNGLRKRGSAHSLLYYWFTYNPFIMSNICHVSMLCIDLPVSLN